MMMLVCIGFNDVAVIIVVLQDQLKMLPEPLEHHEVSSLIATACLTCLESAMFSNVCR